MAKEANVPFLFVSASAFQSMYYGQTNRKIRSFFKQLRKHAHKEGGAIGFIEEIDAIGATRRGMGGSGGTEGVSGVVNELLVQLQSFDTPTRGSASPRPGSTSSTATCPTAASCASRRSSPPTSSSSAPPTARTTSTLR